MSSNGTDAASSDVHLSASYQSHVLACAIATWTIAAIFVSLRFYLRGRLMNVLGREDWTILVSLIFSFGVSASFITEAYYGLGKHVAALTTRELEKASEVSKTGGLFYCSSFASIRHADHLDRHSGSPTYYSPLQST